MRDHFLALFCDIIELLFIEENPFLIKKIPEYGPYIQNTGIFNIHHKYVNMEYLFTAANTLFNNPDTEEEEVRKGIRDLVNDPGKVKSICSLNKLQ
jgi:hypothetical protein